MINWLKTKYSKVLPLLLLTILFSKLSNGQEIQNDVEMADGLRSSGKIYVVVGVLVIIFIGIIIYLLRLDKKISDLEKRLNK